MMDLQKVKEALKMASDYINDGSLLPQDMDHPYFKTSEAIDNALASLEKPSEDCGDAETILHLTEDLTYIAGIVERGENRKLDPKEPVTKAVLNYVIKLESQVQRCAKRIGINKGNMAEAYAEIKDLSDMVSFED